jgi:5-methylcytosine-specific restriction endonuclease McrA
MQREYLSKERRQFYRSKAWQKCRAGYWEYRHGICERCGRVASQVHHRIYLTDANLKDPEVSLAWENLELLCDKCHAEEHHGGGFQTGEGYSFNEYGDLVYSPPVDLKK